MKRIVVCGYFGYGNAGDELILKSMVSNLRKEIRDISITVLSSRPQDTENTFQVKAINRWNMFSIFRSFVVSDLVIFSGGLFQDVTGFLSIYYYLALIIFAKLLRKKVLLYGVEFAPIKRKMSLWALGLVLKYVDRIAVRSQGSLKLIGDFKMKNNPELSADGVMLNNAEFKVQDDNRDLKKVGLILRRNENPLFSDEEYLRVITGMCESIVNRLEVELVFIPFHLEKDFEFALEISRRLGFSAVISRWNNADDLFDILRDVDFIISQRLHGLVIGSILKIPLLGISDDQKLEFFCSELGQKYISLKDFNPNTIAGVVEDIWKWQDDFRSLLDKNIPKLKYRSYLNMAHALELLS